MPPSKTAGLSALYSAGSPTAAEETLRAIGKRYSTRRSAPRSWSKIYYDTFDWRLHRDGGQLSAALESGGKPLLRWLAGGRLRHRLIVDDVPEFAWDLPRSPFREAIEPVIEMRRLLPRVRLDLTSHELGLLDALRKTVLRVSVERPKAVVTQEPVRGVSLPVRLRLTAVLGFEDEYRDLREFVERELGLVAEPADELESALRAVGQEVDDYSSKLRLKLQPAMRADEGCREILRTLLGTIRANEEGTRQDLDSEFLHDFRVAVRRTRACLGQIKHVFPAAEIEPFRKGFGWLGRATGPTRDLDVFLLELRSYREGVAAPEAAALEPLKSLLEERQRAEQREVARSLESARYRRLLEEWAEFLDRQPAGEPNAAEASTPLARVASRRIRGAARRVLRRGEGLGAEPPAEALHRLRIDCKKLRYLLELFRSLYDPRRVEKLVSGLKRLQDVLGDLNDSSLQQSALAAHAEELLETKVEATTLLAIGRMIERAAAREREERAHFARRFDRFAGVARPLALGRGLGEPVERTREARA